MGLWAYGLMGLWAYGLMGLWAYGLMGLWAYGLMQHTRCDVTFPSGENARARTESTSLSTITEHST